MKCYEKQSKQAHQRTFSPSRQPEAYPTTKLMRVVRAVQEPSPFPPTYPHPALRPALHTTKAQLNGQYPTEWRIVYALSLGWWIALQWSIVAMILDTCHVPAGQTMMSKLPAVFSLQRQR